MMFWAVGFVLALFLLFARSRRRPPSLPYMRRAIVNLDLEPVREKAAQRHQWSAERAGELEAEYRDFLILLAENPKDVVSPWSDALDLFWHEHILDTVKYDADCWKVFGRRIQHDPHIDKDPYRHQSTIKGTTALRAKQLADREARRQAVVGGQAPIATDGFDIATFGCGTDAPADGHGGHGHDGGGGHGGGDHGGGHSDGGGHSCGGHGCGGHGCGGGH